MSTSSSAAPPPSAPRASAPPPPSAAAAAAACSADSCPLLPKRVGLRPPTPTEVAAAPWAAAAITSSTSEATCHMRVGACHMRETHGTRFADERGHLRLSDCGLALRLRRQRPRDAKLQDRDHLGAGHLGAGHRLLLLGRARRLRAVG
eukprot:3332486-Prymnesium_polylepis.1